MNKLRFIEQNGMMDAFKTFSAWLSAYTNSQGHHIDKKTLYLALGLIVFTLFSDTLLSLVGHCLHVIIEIIESIAEHFLESMFDLSPRQAEMTVFYCGFLIGLGLFAHLLWKAYLWEVKVCTAAKKLWQAQSKFSKFAMLIGTFLILTSLMSTLLMFT